MTISPDGVVLWQSGPFRINATLFFTWLVMVIMAFGSWMITRRLRTETRVSRWQNMLEILVIGIRDQIRSISRQEPGPFLPFVGTVFLFIAFCNLLTIVPGYQAPTGSLSTATALAICVFLAIPLFGVSDRGLKEYLKHYVRPNMLMLPFNLMGEVSRTIALAVRLFGNIMSGAMIVGMLLSITPFLFPVVMQLFGLLTGLIQAYIFAVLAMVYISSATRAYHEKEPG